MTHSQEPTVPGEYRVIQVEKEMERAGSQILGLTLPLVVIKGTDPSAEAVLPTPSSW